MLETGDGVRRLRQGSNCDDRWVTVPKQQVQTVAPGMTRQHVAKGVQRRTTGDSAEGSLRHVRSDKKPISDWLK